MKITQTTLRKIIREELQEAYKSPAQREKELNAEIRMIKKDPEFRALVALEKAYHKGEESIDDEAPTVRYILNRRAAWNGMSPADAMRNVIRKMSPGLHEFAIEFEAMQPYFGAVNEVNDAQLNKPFMKTLGITKKDGKYMQDGEEKSADYIQKLYDRRKKASEKRSGKGRS